MANFTQEQMRAIEAQGKTIVSASAGSGKTTVMIEKIIRLIKDGAGVGEILAVTFTKKAAAQMKEKLCKELIEEINRDGTDSARRERMKKQLSEVPGADISTIHSFCAKLLRSHFYLAGVDSAFRVIGGDDAEGTALKNAALDELLEEGIQEGTIIGITIKKPEKERKYTNFRVTKEDLEWLSKIKKLLFFCKRLKLKRVRILK